MDRRMPPGLSDGDVVETATASRERRRVGLAAKVAAEQMSQVLASRLDAIELKLDRTLAYMADSMERHFATDPPELARSAGEDRSLLVDERLQRIEKLLFSADISKFDEAIRTMLIQKAPAPIQTPDELDADSKSLDEFYDVILKNIVVQTEPMLRNCVELQTAASLASKSRVESGEGGGEGGGGHAAPWQPLPKPGRCLKAGVSDAAEEGRTQVARPILVPHAHQENNIVGNDIPQPADASWVRLANAELA